ncbi:unnamed protein product [Gadus morhua 'NCC']
MSPVARHCSQTKQGARTSHRFMLSTRGPHTRSLVAATTGGPPRMQGKQLSKNVPDTADWNCDKEQLSSWLHSYVCMATNVTYATGILVQSIYTAAVCNLNNGKVALAPIYEYGALETLNGTQQNNGTLLYRAAGEESVV